MHELRGKPHGRGKRQYAPEPVQWARSGFGQRLARALAAPASGPERDAFQIDQWGNELRHGRRGEILPEPTLMVRIERAAILRRRTDPSRPVGPASLPRPASSAAAIRAVAWIDQSCQRTTRSARRSEERR